MDLQTNILQSTAIGIPTKTKRKLGATKGVCLSFRERSEDHYNFSMPDLDDDNKSNSGSSVSNKRAVKLKLCSNSNSSKKSDSIQPNKISEELKSMKDSSISKSGFCSKSPPGGLSYLFVTQTKPKNEKEKKILDYLNLSGVYQIHLSEVLKAFPCVASKS